jgi:hypothetical protein
MTARPRLRRPQLLPPLGRVAVGRATSRRRLEVRGAHHHAVPTTPARRCHGRQKQAATHARPREALIRTPQCRRSADGRPHLALGSRFSFTPPPPPFVLYG